MDFEVINLIIKFKIIKFDFLNSIIKFYFKKRCFKNC